MLLTYKIKQSILLGIATKNIIGKRQVKDIRSIDIQGEDVHVVYAFDTIEGNGMIFDYGMN